MDQYTAYRTVGFGSRVMQSLKGVIFGLVLLVVAFPLLWWNEGRAVRTARGLAEGEREVLEAAPGRINPANQGKLVHVTGGTEVSGAVRDPLFGVSAAAIKLHRKVEMYQWRESSSSRTSKRAGGSQTTKTTYSYAETWSESPIDSDRFKHPEGHQNPPMPYRSADFNAGQANLGAFRLSGSLIGQLSANDAVDVSTANLPEALRDRARAVGSGFQFGDPGSPKVGDLRVTFQQLRPTVVSVVARQSGNTFVPYRTKEGGDIEMADVGQETAAQMFAAAERRNTLLTWGLRAGGLLLMWLALRLLVGPLATMADVVPLAGSLVRSGLGLLSFLMALALSLLTGALAWISYRPMLGLALLVAMILVVIALARKRHPVPTRA